MNEIQKAQMLAGENAVIEGLRGKGLLPKIKNSEMVIISKEDYDKAIMDAKAEGIIIGMEQLNFKP